MNSSLPLGKPSWAQHERGCNQGKVVNKYSNSPEPVFYRTYLLYFSYNKVPFMQMVTVLGPFRYFKVYQLVSLSLKAIIAGLLLRTMYHNLVF